MTERRVVMSGTAMTATMTAKMARVDNIPIIVTGCFPVAPSPGSASRRLSPPLT